MDIFATTTTNHRKVQPTFLMETLKKPPTIRDLMPESYLGQLVASTGCKNYSNLAKIVRYEHTTSKFWPAVLALAEAAKPEAYAAWAAANPDKLPAQLERQAA